MNFKKYAFILLLCLSLGLNAQKDAKQLIEQMVEANGGKDAFYALKNVNYQYTYHNLSKNKKDVSMEKYVFDGEKSWASFSVRENMMSPKIKGKMIQSYNGKTTWTSIDGNLTTDKTIHRLSDFLRKTNYYWFAMMFKLLDDGIFYKYSGTRTVNNLKYDIVEISYSENIGDVQDKYVLYINQKTHLIDQFLFTVLDFNITTPHIMIIKYDDINGIKIPARRKYAVANWNGDVLDDKWTTETCTNISFNTTFPVNLFMLEKN